MTPKFRKGHIFGDKSYGLELLKDVYSGDAIEATDYKPLGDCPKPVPGDMIPFILRKHL